MSRKHAKSVTKAKGVTPRYKTPLPVLVPATEQKYDGLANFDSKKPLQPVRVFDSAYDAEGSALNRAVRASMGRAWLLFIAVTQLMQAHEAGDKYGIDEAFRKLLTALAEVQSDPNTHKEIVEFWSRIAEFWSQSLWSSRTAPFNVPPAVSHELDSARLVLWWSKRDKKFLPAIFCKDYTAAMFTRMVLRDLRACPGCDRPFVPERPDQQYCQPRCSGRHRQRRRRAKS